MNLSLLNLFIPTNWNKYFPKLDKYWISISQIRPTILYMSLFSSYKYQPNSTNKTNTILHNVFHTTSMTQRDYFKYWSTLSTTHSVLHKLKDILKKHWRKGRKTIKDSINRIQYLMKIILQFLTMWKLKLILWLHSIKQANTYNKLSKNLRISNMLPLWLCYVTLHTLWLNIFHAVLAMTLMLNLLDRFWVMLSKKMCLNHFIY